MSHHHHHHHHSHEHSHLLSPNVRIAATVVLLTAAVIIEHTLSLSTWQLLLIYLVPYLLIGADTLKEAAEGLLHGDAFNEHFLMSVATIGALCIGFLPGTETEFPEAVFVMLFFQIGERFEHYAEGKSRDSIAHLMDIRPDVARVITTPDGKQGEEVDGKEGDGVDSKEGDGVDSKEGEEMCTEPDKVSVGTIIEVRPGEKVPIDGIVVQGTSTLNTMALTGESMPRAVSTADEVLSGCINISGVLRIRTTKTFSESTVAKIIQLVEDAAEHKSQTEAFITKFARIYTPIVVIAALLIACVPPLVLSASSPLHLPASTWIYRALMFLVVSCPCALVISVPLTFFAGIGGASRKGILVKGANFLDVLAKVDTVVFDKTGTLTHGQFTVQAVHPDIHDPQQLLHLAAHVEHFSTHPIAAALRNAFPEEATDGCIISSVEEIAGKGIQACVDGNTVCVGNTKLMDAVGAQWHPCSQCTQDVGTVIHVAINGSYAGHIVINDQVKTDSAEAIAQLKQLGVKRTVMLTGDRQEVAARVAAELRLDEYHAELLPADKVEQIENLRSDSASLQGKSENMIAFVGDGINDAPVLARADVGIAMGALGSDAAIEAADVVLMDDKPAKIATAIRLARRTISIARQNIWFAVGVKAAVLVLAAIGLGTMWMAVFADVGVTVLAVLNAMRALKS
mgnify:CR=1 FL=1